MKKRMVTLAIVGAMAVAAMAPATVFAREVDTSANSQTAVSYNANGSQVTTDGQVVAIIPKAVALDGSGGTTALNVSLQVATSSGTYTIPDATTNPIGAVIDMSVSSANDFEVVSSGSATGYAYTYTSGSYNSATAPDAVVATFTDGTGGSGANYTADGTVKFTGTGASGIPTSGTWSDTLTFTFADGAGAP